MKPNIEKTHLLNVKSELSARLLDNCIEPCKEQRDLGLIVSCNLSWNSNCHQSSAKAMSTLFQIKRNLVVNCSVKTKLDAYTGYIVPIVTYASQAWCANRQNLQEVEHIQKAATKWILATNAAYIDRLLKPNLLHLCLYIEMHDLLFLLALLRNQYDVRIKSESAETTRQAQRGEFKVLKSRLRKTNNNQNSTNQNTVQLRLASVQGLRNNPEQNYTKKNLPSFL